jgi:hypothetical protein
VAEQRNRLWRAKTQLEASRKYVREKGTGVGTRKGSHGMVEIKPPCFR